MKRITRPSIIPNTGPRDGSTLPRVEKPDVVRYLGPADSNTLRVWAERLSEKAWQQEDAVKENDFFCFVHTQHIIFRFIPGNLTPLRYYSNPAWMVWQRHLLPVMAQAAALYGYARPIFPKAVLARLAAGREIALHIDAEAANPFTHKIHLPLRTDPRALLIVDGVALHLEADHFWEVNNLVPHGAFNGGDRDRIHFIFEMYEGAAGGSPAHFSNIKFRN